MYAEKEIFQIETHQGKIEIDTYDFDILFLVTHPNQEIGNLDHLSRMHGAFGDSLRRVQLYHLSEQLTFNVRRSNEDTPYEEIIDFMIQAKLLHLLPTYR